MRGWERSCLRSSSSSRSGGCRSSSTSCRSIWRRAASTPWAMPARRSTPSWCRSISCWIARSSSCATSSASRWSPGSSPSASRSSSTSSTTSCGAAPRASVSARRPWTALLAFAFILGYSLRGWRLAILSGGTVMYFAIFGLWKYAMENPRPARRGGADLHRHRPRHRNTRLQEEVARARAAADIERGPDPAALRLSHSGGGVLRHRPPDRGHRHHHLCRSADGPA